MGTGGEVRAFRQGCATTRAVLCGCRKPTTTGVVLWESQLCWRSGPPVGAAAVAGVEVLGRDRPRRKDLAAHLEWDPSNTGVSGPVGWTIMPGRRRDGRLVLADSMRHSGHKPRRFDRTPGKPVPPDHAGSAIFILTDDRTCCLSDAGLRFALMMLAGTMVSGDRVEIRADAQPRARTARRFYPAALVEGWPP